MKFDPTLIKTIKDNVTMDDVVAAVGLAAQVPRNRKLRSPWSADTDPSLHLYRHDWFDYSTGKGGDQIRFVMEYLNVRFPEAVQFLASGIGLAPVKREPDKPPPPPDLTQYWRDIPEPEDIDRRLLETWAPEKWGLTADEVLEFPTNKLGPLYLYTAHFDPTLHVVRGIKRRHLNTGNKSAVTGSKFTYGLYWPMGVCGNNKLLLVEGESDAWVAWKRFGDRYDVAALPSGANVIHEDWFKDFKYRDVVIFFDDDEAGRNAAVKVWKIVTPGAFAVAKVPPTGRFAESVMEGWRL